MSNNIEGKVVVITGTSSGLGEATARLLYYSSWTRFIMNDIVSSPTTQFAVASGQALGRVVCPPAPFIPVIPSRGYIKAGCRRLFSSYAVSQSLEVCPATRKHFYSGARSRK